MKKDIFAPQSPPHLALFHGAFGPMRQGLRAYRIIGFDTEDDTRGLPLSFAFHDGVKPYYTHSWDKALDYIYNYPVTAVFMAHNLEYDIGNLFKACDFKYIKEMVYASKLLKVTLFGTHHFFLNTSSFFAGSLASMGKIVGLPKLEGNSLSQEYAVRDAQIVQVFGSKLQTRLHAQGINLGLSIGQLAMATYRTKYLKQKQVTYNSPNCLKAYYGGRVELFYKGVQKGPVYVADIKSSYPDVMRRLDYPDTSFMEPSSLFTHQFGIGKFCIHIPGNLFIPGLPFRSDSGRLFFPTGKITGWWTYAEVRFAVERLGCTVLEELEGEGTNHACRPFVDFIDSIYDERQAWARRKKINPDDTEAAFEDLFLKLLMNNLYGKFSQHKPSTKMTRFKMSDFELSKLGAYEEHKRGPFYAYKIPKEKPPKTANYLWGVYVTSYARLSLLEKMLKVHDAGGTLLYCDTDSIMFTGEKALKTLDIGGNLGQMSLETYDLAVFRAAKGYLLCNRARPPYLICSKNRLFNRGDRGQAIGENIQRRYIKTQAPLPGDYRIVKVACKGVPTAFAHDFIVKGMAEFLKPMRLKEAIIRTTAKENKGKDAEFFRDIGINIWKTVKKWMMSIHIKRKGEKGPTWPVDVAEIPDQEAAAYGKQGSWEMDIAGTPLREPPKKKDVFRNIQVPADWFLSEADEAVEEAYFDAQQIHYLKREETLEIKPGETWLKGKITDRRRGKFGRYYVAFLSQYLGENVKKKNILVALPEKYFLSEGQNFAYLNKTVEFLVKSPYTLKEPLKLTVKISE